MIFTTLSAQHILSRLSLPVGKRIIKQFSDGQWYVKVEESVNNTTVWVLGSTISPAENLLELLFLLDALHRNGAKIKLLIPYFSFARQDTAAVGEALNAEVILNCFKQFSLEKITIIHVHNPTIIEFLPFKNVIPLSFFTDIAKEVDCIVAPDKGAHDLACAVAKQAEKPLVFMHKARPSHEQAEIVKVVGEVTGKKALLVDDILATGTTLIQAADELKKRGVSQVYAAVTHGLFTNNAHEKILHSSLEKVFVTNTIVQKEFSAKVMVVDISNLLEDLLV